MPSCRGGSCNRNNNVNNNRAMPASAPALPPINNLATTLPTASEMGNGQQQKQSGFKKFFVGEPSVLDRLSNYTPFQQNAFNQSSLSGLNSLQNPYEGFDPIAQRATSLFNQQTVPTLAERFTSLGNNSITSPAFASQLGQAGSGLSEALAALQSQYGLQNRGQGLKELALGLSPQYQLFQRGGSQGALGGFMQGGGLESIAKLISLFL